MTQRPITLLADTVRPLSQDDYDADRATMLQALLGCGAQAVYEIGAVNAPGISDLDFVALFGNDSDLGRCSPPLATALQRTARTFLHPPWAIRRGQLSLLPSLFAVRVMNDLRGGPSLAPIQSVMQRQCWNIEAAASALAVLTSRRRATTRSVLCLLNGVRYNVELAAADGIAIDDPEDACGRIAALRRDWFGLPREWREAEALRLWAECTRLLRTVLQGHASALAQHLQGTPEDLMLPVPGTSTSYLFAAQPRSRRFLGSPFANLLPLPQQLGALFASLAGGAGGLHRWLQPQRLGRGSNWRFQPETAAAIASYARDNARYLEDQLAAPHPFLLLGGGTLLHVRNTRAARLAGLLRRARARLAPTGH